MDLSDLAHERAGLASLAAHLIADVHGGEDLAQESLYRLLRAAPQRGEPARAAWLRTTLRRLAISEWRGRDRRRQREREVARPEATPSSQEIAERAEQCRRIHQAMDALPRAQADVLRDRYFGELTASAIAARDSLSINTVKARITRARAALREVLERDGVGGDTHWSIAIAPLALAGKWGAASHPQPIGAIGVLISMKKVITIVAVLAAVAAGGYLLERGRVTQGEPHGAVARSEGGVGTPGSDGELETAAAADSRRREVTPDRDVPSSLASGSLRIHALWQDDGSSAGGVLLTVTPWGSLHPALLQRDVRTGSDGTVVVSNLSTGPVLIQGERGGRLECSLLPGETADVEFVIPPGVEVLGRVVDDGGVPVPGAAVWLSTGARTFARARRVTSADDAGRFSLRSVEPMRFVSASAPGRRFAAVQPLPANAGEPLEVELVLAGLGATLTGSVVDTEGQPVTGAKVLVGHRDPGSLAWTANIHAEYRPQQILTTDDQGVFRADGLAHGVGVPLWVRAKGWSVWTQTVPVAAHGDSFTTIQLARGATVSGRVTDGAGDPVIGAFVTYRDSAWPSGRGSFDATSVPRWAYDTVSTDGGGRFRLEGVSAGSLRMLAGAGGIEARGTVDTADGVTTIWNPALVDLVIHGRVVDARGAPLPGVELNCVPARGSGRRRSTSTDSEGRFRCGGLAPVPHRLTFHMPDDGLHAAPISRLWGIVPGDQEVLVQVADVSIPSSSISGTLVASGGQEPIAAQVRCSAQGLTWCPEVDVDAETGRFLLGPLPAGSYRLQTIVGDPERQSAWSEIIVLRSNEALDVGPLQVPGAGSIIVSLTDAEGSALEGVPVSLETSTGWSASLGPAVETSEGIVRLDNVGPGNYRVRAGGGDWPSVYESVEVRAGEEASIAIIVPRGVECRVLIGPPTEATPLRESFEWMWNGEFHELWDNQWESGVEVALPMNLVPGEWEIRVTSETGRSVVSKFVVTPDDPSGTALRVHLP